MCKQEYLWKKEHEALKIESGDIISDSGAEIGSVFASRKIKNVILMGVHTNMCVIDRSFGLRNMTRLGMNVVLMRDLTDTMYNPEMWPKVSHFSGNSLVTEYIEQFVSPTIVSSDFTGKKQFRFKDDTRPVVAMIMAENEYRAEQRMPEFAHDLLLKNFNCEFAAGKPIGKGEGRHDIRNLQILEDASVAMIYVRRRALKKEQMDLIHSFVESGKPILGIRTASHAFEAKEDVKDLEQWIDFDKEILGGNYQGHYGHLENGTAIKIVPGMSGHPILKGVDSKGFTSPNWLYKNSPLRSENIQVLLTGEIPNELPEPVLWINQSGKNKVVYTSLGHWDDWRIESFRTLMMNSVNFLLDSSRQ